MNADEADLVISEGVLAATVREVSLLEQRELGKASTSERIAARVTSATGTMTFVLLNVAWFAIWIVLNLGGMRTQFDPFPFSFLTMIVSLEAIVLAILVLISENAQARQADRRARLELQVNVLAEREISKLVAMVAEIHGHIGLQDPAADDLQEMQQPTSLDRVAETVEAISVEVEIDALSPNASSPATPNPETLE